MRLFVRNDGIPSFVPIPPLPKHDEIKEREFVFITYLLLQVFVRLLYHSIPRPAKRLVPVLFN